jgi:glycosyltransferase involved in cell wall biosynthesis
MLRRSSGSPRTDTKLATTTLHIRETVRPLVAALADAAGAGTAGASRVSALDPATEDDHLRREVIARIGEARRRAASGDQGRDIVSNAAYQASATPAVTVVVTLYNYGRFIEQCLTSVLSSDPVAGGCEIVVVDDASTDDSTAAVERVMVGAPMPVLLVRKHLNTGLAEARNAGLELARAPHVFILDADNWVYPSCLRTLHEALGGTSYAAAYGIVRRFDDDTGEGVGLVSTGGWDVEALVRGPYIDAMAMLDRAKVLALGGYSTELIEHGWFGWEDYDLWLKLARAGHQCLLVPSILSSYRMHSGSMLRRTNRSSHRIARHLQTKFRSLAADHPGLDRYFGFPASRPFAASPLPSAWGGDEALLQRCLDLSNQLEAVYASGSWRVTRPLRWLFGLFVGR